MDITKAEQKLIENEMIFRRTNEKVGAQLDALDAMHKKDGDHDLVRDDDLSLLFKCECSDENCDERIPLQLDTYQKIHANRDTFIVKPKHQVEEIEEVIAEKDGYSIVKKNNSTPEPNNILNNTSINNS